MRFTKTGIISVITTVIIIQYLLPKLFDIQFWQMGMEYMIPSVDGTNAVIIGCKIVLFWNRSKIFHFITMLLIRFF